MQLTQETVNLYQSKAPELMNSVTSGEAEFIMRRDDKTDYCIEFQAGWCGVHKKYGTEFLGDACHFFPRSTRALGDITVMTMALSCPEATRLMLFEDGAHTYHETMFERVPHSLRDYASQGLSAEAALNIHEACVAEMGNEAHSAERNFMRLSAMARGLELQPKEQWEAAVPFYYRMAEGRIPPAEPKETDQFMLLNALQGLVHAAPASPRERLMHVLTMTAHAMGVTLNWEKLILDLHPDGMTRLLKMKSWWQEHASCYQPVLRRYLQAQLRLNLFPFAGLGNRLAERVTIIGVRFATVKLALMAACFEAQTAIDDAEIVRIVQSLSRFQDHLADPQLSLSIYEETGWTKESRLRALVGDL